MAALGHLFFFVCYAGLSGVAVLYLPRWLPSLDHSLAIVAGGFLALSGALLHEIMTRATRTGGLGRQLQSQRQVTAELEEELTWTRREVRAVREALEAVVRREESGDDERMGEVMAELNVLKALVTELAKAEARRHERSVKPKARPAGPARDGARVGVQDGARGGARTIGPARPAPAPPGGGDILTLVREALRTERIELFMQPIVTLPQRKPRFFECYSRLLTAEGERLLPDQFLPVAEDAGLITAIDNMLLFRCIQLIRRVEQQALQHDFFCNVSLATLRDEAFFGDFVSFLEANRELATHLVFELTQADFMAPGAVAQGQLERLAGLGCRFSLDRLTDLKLDPTALAARAVRFVKVEVDRMTAGNADECLRAFESLSKALARQRIELVVEKIETEAQLLEVLDYGALLGQGYLFGEPRGARQAA